MNQPLSDHSNAAVAREWADAYNLCICGRDNQTYCDHGKYEAGDPPCARVASDEEEAK